MDKKLQLLDSFMTQGSDGTAYKVMAYEHLHRNELLTSGQDLWEPTGQTEYRLSTGERVDMAHDGSLRVLTTGVVLSPRVDSPPARPASKARRHAA